MSGHHDWTHVYETARGDQWRYRKQNGAWVGEFQVAGGSPGSVTLVSYWASPDELKADVAETDPRYGYEGFRVVREPVR